MFVELRFCAHLCTNAVILFEIAIILSSLVQYPPSSRVFLQRAGLVGAAGLYAARNVVVESRCAAEAASLRMLCAREQLRKGVLATLSHALVSPPVIQSLN